MTTTATGRSSFDGVQTNPQGEEPQDIETTFWIEADMWKDSIEEAVQDALDRISRETTEN